MKLQDGGENCIMRSFIMWTVRQILFKSRRMRWVRHVACMGDMRNAYTVLVVKPEGKISL
jgi:hypothetical protein